MIRDAYLAHQGGRTDAERAADAERRACLQIARQVQNTERISGNVVAEQAAKEIADAIEARGKI